MARVKPRIHRRATLLIEAALLFPILLFLTFATLEYGWILLKSHQLSNAARQGARVAARADSTADQVNSTIDSLMSAANITGYSKSIAPSVDIDSGQILTVTVNVAYINVALVNIPLVPIPANLESAVSMAKEGT